MKMCNLLSIAMQMAIVTATRTISSWHVLLRQVMLATTSIAMTIMRTLTQVLQKYAMGLMIIAMGRSMKALLFQHGIVTWTETALVILIRLYDHVLNPRGMLTIILTAMILTTPFIRAPQNIEMA